MPIAKYSYSSGNVTSLLRQKERLDTNAKNLYLFLSFLTGIETSRVHKFSLTTAECSSGTGVRSVRRDRPQYGQPLSLSSVSCAQSNWADLFVRLIRALSSRSCSHHHVHTCKCVCFTGLGSYLRLENDSFCRYRAYNTNRLHRYTIPSYNTNAFDIVFPECRTARTAKKH